MLRFHDILVGNDPLVKDKYIDGVQQGAECMFNIVFAIRSKIDKGPRDVRIAKSGKIPTSSGKRLVSTIRTFASPKWNGTRCPDEFPACYTRRKCSIETSYTSIKGRVQEKKVTDWYKVWPVEGCHCIWSGYRISLRIRERGTAYCLIRSPYRPLNFFNDDFKRSLTFPCSRSLFESRVALRIKHTYKEEARAYRISCEIKTS